MKYFERQNIQNQTISNSIMMIINQNVLAILRAFLNLKKKIYEKLYTKQTSTAATTGFLGKIPIRKKISIEHFNLCETEISLDVS